MNRILRRMAGCACAFLIVLPGTAATITLNIGDPSYVGSINDGIPSNPANELGYLQNLVTLAPGQADTVIGTETYNRLLSTLNPLASVGSFVDKDDTGATSYSGLSAGTYYVLGKYDAAASGSAVWLVTVAAGDTLSLQGTLNRHDLSHISIFGANGSVPDGGATVALLGLAMMGLASVKRVFSK